MSDAVSNAEIEDVLSSIRRLVAGDRDETEGAGEPDGDQAEISQEDSVESQEALILTPSLRVGDEEADSRIEHSVPEESTTWESDPEADARGSADKDAEVLERLSEILESEAANPVPSGAVARPEDDGLPTFIRPVQDDTNASSGEDSTAGTAYPPRPGFHVGSLRDQDEDHPSPASAGYPEVIDAAGADDSGERREEEETSWRPEDEFVVDSTDTDQPDSPLQEQHVSEPEADFHSRYRHSEDAGDPDEAETDDGHTLPEVTHTRATEGRLNAASLRIASERMESESSEDDGNLFADSGVPVDEEMLRELVSEIVHRELQGALGERITRNVRKLVRREIQRALAARDFE